MFFELLNVKFRLKFKVFVIRTCFNPIPFIFFGIKSWILFFKSFHISATVNENVVFFVSNYNLPKFVLNTDTIIIIIIIIVLIEIIS